MAEDDLSRFEEWFGRILAGLSPAERRRASFALAQKLRQSNLKRIAANVDATGAPMAAKKPRYDKRGRLRAKGGKKMFRGLRRAKNWKIDADAQGLEIKPLNGLVDRIASINQFGETATVGRMPGGKRIRTRYAERRLLGFSQDDETLVLDIASDLIERGTR